MPYQQFTQPGLQLLAEAAATDEIIIDRVFISEDYHHPDTVDDYATDPDGFYSQFGSADVIGTILSAGVADTTGSNKARIVVNLKLANSATETKEVRTVVISAHHKPVSEGARSEVLFCATYLEPNTDEPLTLVRVPQGALHRTIDIAFEFAFENDSHVTVSSDTANQYLLADEMSRFMTVHSAESSVVGNNQDIYGKKTFKDDVTFTTGPSGGDVEFMNGLTVWPDVTLKASRIAPSGVDGYIDDGTIEITTENGLSINGPTTCQDITASNITADTLTAHELYMGDADDGTASIIYDSDNDKLQVSSLFQADGIVHTPLPNVSASAQATSLNTVDVGAIVLLYILSRYSSSETIKPGQMLNPTASTNYSLGFAQMNVSSAGTVTCSLYNNTTEVGIGTYTALSACNIPANGSGFVLAMRVA